MRFLIIKGYEVGQLAKALRYKPESSVFDSSCGHWLFSDTNFQPHYVPGIDSASKGNECKGYLSGQQRRPTGAQG
jgi:hypothetical protein